MEFEKHMCPILDVDGVIQAGKQFDLDITLSEDNREVIFGTIKDCFKEPVKDAVVKLIEVECENGKDIRKPVTHTFTESIFKKTSFQAYYISKHIRLFLK